MQMLLLVAVACASPNNPCGQAHCGLPALLAPLPDSARPRDQAAYVFAVSGGCAAKYQLATLAAMGLLLRVSYELKRAERRHAVRIGGSEDAAAEPMDEPAAAVAASVPMSAEPAASAPASAAANAARGTSRLQSRIEPTFGRLS